MEVEHPPPRRSSRQKSGSLIRFEATPRAPIKRTKKSMQNTSPAPTVNGSGEMEDHSEDDGSPKKKSRRNPGRMDGRGDKADMDSEEPVSQPELQKGEEMNVKMDISQTTNLRIQKDVLETKLLADHTRSRAAERKDSRELEHTRLRASEKPNATVTKSMVSTRSQKVQDAAPYKVRSMAEWKRDMMAKSAAVAAAAAAQPMSRADLNVHTAFPENAYAVKQRVKSTIPQKEILHREKQGKSPAVTTKGTGKSSRRFLWYFCGLVLLALCGAAAVFACKAFPLQQRTKARAAGSSKPINMDQFSNLMAQLKAQFASQRPDLWIRSKIHLEKHLRDVQPSEPVSLIFTAGAKAEKTLHCLAKGFAASFSAALNGSVLHIKGASKAGQQSDGVKLDIDRQLREAFDGDTFAAVIHNLEELPPGSTIIFYRYCDHENAAYRRVFLLFTVLLPRDEVAGELMAVEEMVQDYLKERLVGSSSQTSFNEMDNDKFGGLWSRISHLILPVVPEAEVEEKGC